MANQISIVITAKDQASKKLQQLGDETEKLGNKSAASAGLVQRLEKHVGALAGVSVAAGLATRSLLGSMSAAITEANRLDGALMGLNSVARAFQQDASKATRAAQSLASDGLMTVADSATGLKNLLASGFSLDQAVILMQRFKDSAAFGRQASLGFGQAIASATEGIKNGNSILVDNAGVTKNLSVMLKEAGISADKLGTASSDASVRSAIFNGILKETNAQLGDSARLSESAAGQQAKWDAQLVTLQQRIGSSLQPALVNFLEAVTPVIVAVSDWVAQNPELAAGILITATAVMGLVSVASSLGLAVIGAKAAFSLFGAVSTGVVTGVKAAFTGLAGVVASPLVMPAITVAAALAALALVAAAIASIQQAMDALNNAHKQMQESANTTKTIQQKYYEARDSGDKAKADRYFKMYMNALDSDINMYKDASKIRFASGTNYAPGGHARVGEHGPEDVLLPAGAQVTPAYRTRTDSGRSGATVIIENYNSYNERDDDRFFRDLGFQLELAS